MSSSVVQKALKMFELDEELQDKVEDKKKRKQKDNKPKNAKKLKAGSAFDEKWHFEEKDNTEKNLAYIKALRSLQAVDRETAEKIFEHHNKRSRKSQAKEPKDNSSKTVFTDRDFDKFQEEYNFFD